MGARGKKRWGENYECLVEEAKDRRMRGCMERATTRLCRPLRIFQFFTILVLFAMIVYMTAMPSQNLTHLASILMIVLTAGYLFFMGIDMISQLDGSDLPESPMFFFSLLGMLFFTVAGALLIYYPAIDNNFWALILSRILCFVVSVLFLIEVTMLLASWRQRCLAWARCSPCTPGDDYGHKETKMLFSGDDIRGPDAEFGRLDEATSVSNYAVALEDIDNAVQFHGRRRIAVGHRRQYVDSQSSTPAVCSTQPAEIQTEQECTVITECQTHRIETKEITVQTNSRCELCNREIEENNPPRVVAMPEPNQPSPRQPQIPRPLGGTCGVCPALLRMMQEGMSSPCCQSCNCGEHQPPKYPPDHATQPRSPEGYSPRWSPRESPSTGNAKLDADRSDSFNEEANRYRPAEKIQRVYQTRPFSTHASGLIATRMAGSPDPMTRATLSSICAKRNKRTQTPNKDSPASRDGDNKATVEGRRGCCVRESEAGKDMDTSWHRPRVGETKAKSWEDRTKVTKEPEPKRVSGTVRKLYRNSEPTSAEDEARLGASDDLSLPGACRVTTIKEETREMMLKLGRTEIRELGRPGKMENRRGDELPIQEETQEQIHSERSRTYPKYRAGVEHEKSADRIIEGSKMMSHKVVVTDLDDPGPVPGPVLRLRLEKDLEDSKATSHEPLDPKNRKVANEPRKVDRNRSSKDNDRHKNSPPRDHRPIDERGETRLEENCENSSGETEEIIEESQGATTVRSDYSASNRTKRTRSITRKDDDT